MTKSRRFFLLLHPLLSDLLYLLSSDESDFFNDESDDDGSESGSAGTCAFPFCSDDSVGHFSGMGTNIFVPTGIESNCDVGTFVLSVLIGVESKGGRLIKMLLRSNF